MKLATSRKLKTSRSRAGLHAVRLVDPHRDTVGSGIYFGTPWIMGHPFSAVRRPIVAVLGQFKGHAKQTWCTSLELNWPFLWRVGADNAILLAIHADSFAIFLRQSPFQKFAELATPWISFRPSSNFCAYLWNYKLNPARVWCVWWT